MKQNISMRRYVKKAKSGLSWQPSRQLEGSEHSQSVWERQIHQYNEEKTFVSEEISSRGAVLTWHPCQLIKVPLLPPFSFPLPPNVSNVFFGSMGTTSVVVVAGGGVEVVGLGGGGPAGMGDEWEVLDGQRGLKKRKRCQKLLPPSIWTCSRWMGDDAGGVEAGGCGGRRAGEPERRIGQVAGASYCK